jgi:histidyl-tRNA synthetase
MLSVMNNRNNGEFDNRKRRSEPKFSTEIQAGRTRDPHQIGSDLFSSAITLYSASQLLSEKKWLEAAKNKEEFGHKTINICLKRLTKTSVQPQLR